MPAEPAEPPPTRRTKSASRAKSASWASWPALAALLLAAAVGAANVYLITRSRDVVVVDFAKTPSRPYAMVLGSHVFEGGIPSRDLAGRLETGRQLYRAGLARRIIVSGAAHPGYDEPDAMAAWLEARGVAPADLVIDRGGYRTAASMADAAANGVRSLLVVSQRYHLPRAIYLANRAGMSAVGVPARELDSTLGHWMFELLRETMARAEIVVEVAVRGVRGLPADQIPRAPTG
ncbi:MAG TPA: ElyC/SanA/YdcF family protein [Polyangia bacterium]|jgi:vancomycin permeability regulator SanA|nr:ElyC/SanA/YdcF family protein [Polyangia bacterium]